MIHYLNTIAARLFEPVDIASLAVFRIMFGLLMLWEMWRFYDHDRIQIFAESPFQFKYYGFEWVTPWPGEGLYWHVAVLAVLAFLITIGAFYRITIVLFLLGFTYFFLLDQAYYLNHLYLVIIFNALLCVIPAHRAFSLDAYLWPDGRSGTIPTWSLWALRFQMEIVLIYAGLVKINYDWLHLQPLKMWLQSKTHLFILGPLYSQDWFIAIAAYGVIILHVIGAPLLLFRQTRIYVFVIYVCFHLANHFTFNIGIFPWLTIAATLLFFEPDWPREFMRYLPDLNLNTERFKRAAQQDANNGLLHNTEFNYSPKKILLLATLFIWFVIQILLPLRPLLYPGNVNWTEEGYRFSWRMMLRSKTASATFTIEDSESGRIWKVDPQDYLNFKQHHKMSIQPDMILQFAHYLADLWKKDYDLSNVKVSAEILASLNGRETALLIDPDKDLTKINRSLKKRDWILPFKEPLN